MTSLKAISHSCVTSRLLNKLHEMMMVVATAMTTTAMTVTIMEATILSPYSSPSHQHSPNTSVYVMNPHHYTVIQCLQGALCRGDLKDSILTPSNNYSMLILKEKSAYITRILHESPREATTENVQHVYVSIFRAMTRYKSSSELITRFERRRPMLGFSIQN